MAVVATLTKGYDLDYIWRQVDHGAAKYYIQASENQWRAAGTLVGPRARRPVV